MRLIDADALIDDLMERYCKECNKRKGIKNGKYRIIYEIGEAPCRACEVDDVKAELEEAPTADVVERKNIEAECELAYKHGWSDCFAEHRWIPVTERLPEVGKFVLVNDIYMDELTIAKLLEDKGWEDQHGNWSSFGCVSAWMPLPEPWRGSDNDR